MTQQEWEAASGEERNAQYERCKDPVYFYNTYWTLPDGTKPEPISQEYWQQLINYCENRGYLKRR